MKKYIAATLAAGLLLAGCAEDKGYFIEGTADMPDGNQVFVSSIKGNERIPSPDDTTQVQDGKFELDLPEVDAPSLSFLQFEGINGNVLYISANENISFDVNKDSIRNTVVNGGKENKALYDYLAHLKELNRKMGGIQNDMRQAMMSQDTAKLASIQKAQRALIDNDKSAKKELFERYSDSYVSVMILTDMLNMRTHSTVEIREMFEKVPENLKNTSLGKRIQELLKQRSATEVGAKAPEFSGPNPEGEKLSLNDQLGEYTLLDFWASWCRPCRQENPNIVDAYNKYKDKGFNVFSVSLDRPGQKEKWIEAIEKDNLTEWNHVSNLQHWNDPIAQMYDVKAIPANFILDSEGNIVARNVRGKALQQKLDELMN